MLRTFSTFSCSFPMESETCPLVSERISDCSFSLVMMSTFLVLISLDVSATFTICAALSTVFSIFSWIFCVITVCVWIFSAVTDVLSLMSTMERLVTSVESFTSSTMFMASCAPFLTSSATLSTPSERSFWASASSFRRPDVSALNLSETTVA